jgi:exopolysaccharide biosynthesis polyprenyl glycosylphosphotransferase
VHGPAAFYSRGEAVAMALIALPVTILALVAGRGYTAVRRQSRTRMAWHCVVGPTVGLAAVTLVAFALHLENWSRTLVFCFWALSILQLLLSRLIVRRFLSWRHARGRYSRTVAAIGHRHKVQALLERVAPHCAENDYKLVGYYDVSPVDAKAGDSFRFTRLGAVGDFAGRLIHTPVNLILIVESEDSHFWLPDVMRTCDYFRLSVQVVSDALLGVEDQLTDLRPRNSPDQLPFAGVVFEPSELDSDWAVLKRLLDVAISSFALIVLTPVFLAIAAAIKLTTPRLSVIYPYRQIGLHGVEFTAYKFTTMVRDAERLKASLEADNEMQGPVFKIKNDPRVTRLGKFLRAFSLNELPQFWNVLKGDLSLVGPRAALPTELTGYKVWHKRKLTVKPGLTCLWQVSGRNRISNFDEWVRLDLRYIDNWSLWLDFKILARTAWVVLRGSGS